MAAEHDVAVHRREAGDDPVVATGVDGGEGAAQLAATMAWYMAAPVDPETILTLSR